MGHGKHAKRWLIGGTLTLLSGCASWENERVAAPDAVWKPIAPAVADATVLPAAAVDPAPPKAEPVEKGPPRFPRVFDLPPELPGAEAKAITLPPLKDLPPAEREKIIASKYPVLSPLEQPPAESGDALTLSQFQKIALERNPAIRRAEADVDVSYGNMIQAGLYPNPTVGYQGDQIQPGSKPSNNSGQQGIFIQQLIKVFHKLPLARAAAGMDYANAQVALRRTQLDVLGQVRANYFALLVARESMKDSKTLADMAGAVYGLQLRQVASGNAAGYEPLQLYSQAVQAQNVYVQARNRYAASWRQLAASLGEPDMPLPPVDGAVAAAVPKYDMEAARDRVLNKHTDILTALNTILQAQYQFRLQRITPIPDIQTQTAWQHDNATGNNQAQVQIGLEIPVFNRNQGNVFAARATMARAEQDLRARRNDLASRFAEAYARYRTSQAIVANYSERVLPNLASAYRSIYNRYQQEPDKVGFNDVVVAQQNYGQALGTYLAALGDLWTAVVDTANLLQIDDIYEPIEGEAIEPRP